MVLYISSAGRKQTAPADKPLEEYPSWPKGTDCKSVSCAFTGSNPVPSITLSGSSQCRGVEQLAARRAHNPKVAGSSPVPATKRSSGVAVNMPACHAGDRGFDSRLDRHFKKGLVAQSVEQRTENPCVGGSIPSQATIQ